jgi:hypothetical protein
MLCARPAFAANGDDFNDNTPDPAKWGTDVATGGAVLTERNQRLEYTCSRPTPDDLVLRPWKLTRMPCTGDWEMQIDLVNTTFPTDVDEVNSFGIEIHGPSSADNALEVEMYCSSLMGGGARVGFYAQLETEGQQIAAPDSGAFLGMTYGAVRMAYAGATQVATVYYDQNPEDGYQWQSFGSFGLAGAGGLDANTDWGLTEKDQFPVYVYGYSAAMLVLGGQMYADNFQETGGVKPSATPSPDPIGRFRFRSPTGDPAVTPIVNLTGSYRGVIPAQGGSPPLSTPRNYTADIAQDESGKLATMGTVDGIVGEGGDPNLPATGAVTTVDGTPTANHAGAFTGTVDGVEASASGTMVQPLELVDLGSKAQGLAVTFSYKATYQGIPFSAKNQPGVMPVTPEDIATAQSEWFLDLDLYRTVIKGKEVTAAAATLVLPGGDTIVFPERAVKYSATKGCSLSFKKGTNTSVSPPRIVKKASVAIKGLTFVKEGDDWRPTGGTITYQFLGQKGTASLMDFVGP